jgi:hypothetical protein
MKASATSSVQQKINPFGRKLEAQERAVGPG